VKDLLAVIVWLVAAFYLSAIITLFIQAGHSSNGCLEKPQRIMRYLPHQTICWLASKEGEPYYYGLPADNQ
jgi:hypothetical protein